MRFSLPARARCFRYAGRGLARLLRDEHNAWLHRAAMIAVVVAGLWLRLAPSEWR